MLRNLDSAIQAISTVVGDFGCLESLSVPGLNTMALVQVSQLSSLRFFGISFAGAIAPFLEAKTPDWFPALSDLAVLPMDMATALIPTLTNRHLTEFSIPDASTYTESSWPTEQIAHYFYSALGKHCAHSSLREISIGGTFVNSNATPTAEQVSLYAVDGTILNPLLSFGNLSRVALTSPVGFDLDDATILLMARAWPRVEFLSLTASPCRHMPSRVTLEGLFALAKYCPALNTLDLSFDAKVIPNKGDDEKQAASQNILTYFAVDASPVGDARRVAEFLAAIFPRLARIETLHELLVSQARWDAVDHVPDADVVVSHNAWQEVTTFLPSTSISALMARIESEGDALDEY
ncbi:hypothetical protein B0H16DRAFT_1830060 [Mycena metata]|uniref:F-box domain-containing protein n=1 Tax=Mycena metata TaxID=1033252 RepID=A0AAD7KBM4_9AGAR|nr:hypothetical protein B0H16DRAFT_1830060 [Mycena metata]